MYIHNIFLWEFDGFTEEADYSDQLFSFYYIIVITFLQNFLLGILKSCFFYNTSFVTA